MPNPNEETLEFQCPKCSKRLRASAQIAGKKVKCPQCGQPVKVPGAQVAAPPSDDDWLALDTPAISDRTEREREAAEVKAKRMAAQANQHKIRDSKPQSNNELHPKPAIVPRSRRQPGDVLSVSPSGNSDDDEFTLEPALKRPNATRSATGQQATGTIPPALPSHASTKPTKPDQATSSADRPPVVPARKASVFDDDLPELSELTQAAPKPLPIGNAPSLDDLEGLIPDLDAAFAGGKKATSPTSRANKNSLGPLLEPKPTTDQEYRITCKVCGTPQYVRLSAKGMKIKCPDCHSGFRVPPPPTGWPFKPTAKLELTHEDVPLAAAEVYQEKKTIEAQKSRATAMLAKAQQEISDDEMDRLYEGDFDTAGFVQRTFGFLRDPIAVGFILGYGFVFACVFALAQFGLNNADSGFAKGALLLGVIGAPLVAILFGLPMLSCALALLESVANRQPKVADWPGFNMFDHFGDLLAIATALLGALLPGYLAGTFMGGDLPGSGRIQITGLMITTYLFFPILLLSILDNGSLFQPISASVLSSFRPAAEAWGSYYLKTMLAFSATMILWYVLLGTGKSPWLAGMGGFLIPPLVFFTFQQLGALADSISEHLSFEFAPTVDEPKDADSVD